MKITEKDIPLRTVNDLIAALTTLRDTGYGGAEVYFPDHEMGPDYPDNVSEIEVDRKGRVMVTVR